MQFSEQMQDQAIKTMHLFSLGCTNNTGELRGRWDEEDIEQKQTLWCKDLTLESSQCEAAKLSLEGYRGNQSSKKGILFGSICCSKGHLRQIRQFIVNGIVCQREEEQNQLLYCSVARDFQPLLIMSLFNIRGMMKDNFLGKMLAH